ncbi:cation efflux family-domain-containing protein [Limtongia smithiae]|uniref:cation efflux family-domain-containing protein n=1 Tax=Limtongia smithiae TaxID=1125753 RepID=UPI0034CD6D6D
MALLSKQGRIICLLVIDSAFFLLEVIIGYAVHSLALVADSFHMLNDVFSLLVAFWAVKVANSRAASSEYSYGWQRAEILGALVNGVFLLALCLTIFLEALQRFVEPQTITNPKLVFVVGCAGLLSNILGLLLFHEHGHSHSHGGGDDHTVRDTGDAELDNTDAMEIGALLPEVVVQNSLEQQYANGHASTASSTVHPLEYVEGDVDEATSLLADEDGHSHSTAHSHSHSGHSSTASSTRARAQKAKAKHTQSLNMRGVFLHVMGDALGNVGVIATALFIWFSDYWWRFYFDPMVSLFITCIIFASALPLVKSASKILLQAVPTGINIAHLTQEIESMRGVLSVHDFHIWILRESLFIASLHVTVSVSADDFMLLSNNIRACLHSYGIHSATIQPEFRSISMHSSVASSQASLRQPSTSSPATTPGSVTSLGSGDAAVSIDPLSVPDKFDAGCLCVDGCAEAACCVKNLTKSDKSVHEHEHEHEHGHVH